MHFRRPISSVYLTTHMASVRPLVSKAVERFRPPKQSFASRGGRKRREAHTLSGMMQHARPTAPPPQRRCPLRNGGTLQAQTYIPGVITSDLMICDCDPVQHSQCSPCSNLAAQVPTSGGWRPCFRITAMRATSVPIVSCHSKPVSYMLTTLLYRLRTRLPWDELVVGLASWKSHAPGMIAHSNTLYNTIPPHITIATPRLLHVDQPGGNNNNNTVMRCF